MKITELKTLWKVAKRFWVTGFIFWILETILFLIIEGCHIKATHPIEINCDKIVLYMWEFALNLTIVTSIYFLININKNK